MEFGAFSFKTRHLVATILMIFLRINSPNFVQFNKYWQIGEWGAKMFGEAWLPGPLLATGLSPPGTSHKCTSDVSRAKLLTLVILAIVKRAEGLLR